LEIIERRVKPARLAQNREARKRKWWWYGDRAPGLYESIQELKSVFVTNAQASPHLSIAQLPIGYVYSHALIVFAFSDMGRFSVMQSRPHDVWAWFFSSTLEDRLRYAPSDCFRTFPFPVDTSSNPPAAGQAYHDHRAALMIARNEGMTKTYNRFHDPAESAEDITQLRELHAEMDRAVLHAYAREWIRTLEENYS
jgi:hypothetical protein